MSNDADRLAEKIKHALDRGMPLSSAYEAIDQLATLAKQQAPDTRSEEEIADAVGDIVGVGPGAWDTVHSSLIVRAFQEVLAKQQAATEGKP